MTAAAPTDDQLAAAVLKTVAYFDIFDYPLTPLEIWRWLYLPGGDPCSLETIFRVADQLVADGRLLRRQGMYFLVGKEDIIATRHERYLLAERKIGIARRALRALAWVPYVDMVAVCNNLGYSNTRAAGDIDVVIVATPGHLWFVRFWAVVLMTILGIRCHGRHVTNRICLSFYVTTDHLDWSDIAQRPDDPYLRYFIATLLPLYQYVGGNAYHRCLTANAWTLQDIPNFFPVVVSERRAVSGGMGLRYWRRWSQVVLRGMIGNVIERMCRTLESMKLRWHDRRTPLTAEAHVVISDSMFKRHEQDRRPRYRAAWYERLAQWEL